MGSKRNVSMSVTTDTVKKVVADVPVEEETTSAAKTTSKISTKKTQSRRGKRYVAARSMIDKTKGYSITEAVELVKRTSYGKFDSSISVDAIVRENGDQGSVSFPHSTGKTLRIAIASDEVLFELESGNANFDILLTTPAFMPKLVKYARLLGPKGLMPNPKNNTIVQDPEARKKELEKGKVAIKSERKAPLVHMVIGKTSFETKMLVENVEALVTALDYRLKKLTLSGAMGPGVKVKLS